MFFLVVKVTLLLNKRLLKENQEEEWTGFYRTQTDVCVKPNTLGNVTGIWAIVFGKPNTTQPQGDMSRSTASVTRRVYFSCKLYFI